MSLKTLSYFALVDISKSPGVVKKIQDTVIAAQENGLKATHNIYPTSLSGVSGFLKALVTSNSDVVMIRFSDLVFPIVFFVMNVLRLRGKKIIVDVPTPRSTGLREMDKMVTNPAKRSVRKFISYASASWVLMPANLIIQYADEGKWFSLGLRYKTLKMGNGILITDDIPLTKAVWPKNQLNLIAVAQLADWHGYDRMLYALAELKKQNLPCEVTFTVVGDGEALPFLKKLANDLNLENVNFKGRLTGKDLDDVFANMHVGVASLGLYRVGLNEAAVLKTREYMARGLAVVTAGQDPDFYAQETKKFRYEVSNDSDIVGIVSLIVKFTTNEVLDFDPKACRIFAESNLDLRNKIKTITLGLK